MNRSRIRRGIVGGAAFLTLLATAPRAHAQQGGITVGSVAPDATVQTLDGRMVRLSQVIGGKPALLEFWATWCPLCKQLEPALQAARAKHGHDVVFVSVGVPQNQTAKRQKAYAAEHRLGGHFVFDAHGAAVEAFHAPHTSYVVVLDATGKVVYTGVGGDQNIEGALAHLHGGMGRI